MMGCAGIAPGNGPALTAQDLLAIYQQIVANSKPPVPPVTPPPVVVPTPTPPPVETPVLEATSIKVLDLATLPGELRKTLNLTARDPLMLYALACSIGAKHWACQDAECEGMMVNEAALAKWFDGYMVWVVGMMKQNPLTTATLISNDGNHRFGYWIGPVVAERLKDYQHRWTMGTLVPESEYR
jgi:hypothetical protein